MSEISLEINHLSKKFGTLIAVDNISLSVMRGEIFGLLGPNGAGKTTTIHMISGLLAPDRGEIIINGIRVNKRSPDFFLHTGVCPQQNIFWEKLTCFEQIVYMAQLYRLSKKESHSRAEYLLDQLGLFEKRNQLAGKLSGGMQRRLNIALSIVHDPDLIILDEPESGLDPQSRILFREFIKSLAHKKTVLLTTHNMDEADRLSDRVAIIDHGQLLVVDKPEELKRTIGTGDVVEMSFSESLPEAMMQDFRMKDILVKIVDHTLTLSSIAMIEKIPLVLSVLKKNQLEPLEINFRSNTLEDVFITLTGRRLRE